MSEQEQARALLEAAGVRGITIEGAGDSWRVGVGWNEHERFVLAYSEKNPTTPNDPVYLATQALATLIRNEGPCPFHVKNDPLAPAAEEGQDSGDAGQADIPHPEGDGDALLGATESRPATGEGVEGFEELGGHDLGEFPSESEREADAGLDLGGRDSSLELGAELLADEPPIDPGPPYMGPGVAILPDDLSVALALVIEAVAAEEETRVAAVEYLLASDEQHMRDYGNWPAGVAMDPFVEAGARRFQSLSQQRSRIQNHSLMLRRSARDHRARGDLSALQGMRDALGEGWP